MVIHMCLIVPGPAILASSTLPIAGSSIQGLTFHPNPSFLAGPFPSGCSRAPPETLPSGFSAEIDREHSFLISHMSPKNDKLSPLSSISLGSRLLVVARCKSYSLNDPFLGENIDQYHWNRRKSCSGHLCRVVRYILGGEHRYADFNNSHFFAPRNY